ncbi:MAG: hypothetical protein WA058_00535 [Minisyncoccia bacterium]
MKQGWIKGTTPERAAIIKADYAGSAGARIRLTEMLNDKIRISTTVKRKKEGYDSPNWAYVQADVIGYERALSEVISLISDISE